LTVSRNRDIQGSLRFNVQDANKQRARQTTLDNCEPIRSEHGKSTKIRSASESKDRIVTSERSKIEEKQDHFDRMKNNINAVHKTADRNVRGVLIQIFPVLVCPCENPLR